MSSTQFNISMVLRADTTGAKGGLAEFEAGLRNATAAAEKTGTVFGRSTAELEKLAAATKAVALTQNELAAAEARAQAARGNSIVAPLTNITAQISPVTAMFGSVETSAESLRGAVGGLGTSFDQSAHDMLAAAQASRQYQLALDDVRASFNPIFAASRQYEQQLERIAEAERLGAISALEAAAARQRAANIIAPAAGGVSGPAGSASSMHTANVGAQGFDIGVTAFGGMNPLMIGLQQGSQLAQVMQQMGGGKQALQGIAQGFLGILNPMSLATIGIVAFGAMGIQALMSLGGEAKSFEDAMSELSDAVTSYEKNLRQSRSSTADLAREFGSAAEEVRGLLAEMAELDRRRAQRAASDVVAGLVDDRGLWLPDLAWKNDNPNADNNAQLYDVRRGKDVAELRGLFGLDRSEESKTLVGSVLDAMTRVDAAKTVQDQITALTTLMEVWTAAAEARDGFSEGEDDFLGKIQGALRELQKLDTAGGNAAGAQQATEIFQTYKQQLEVERASLAYGEDSAEVRKLQNQHELDGLKTKLESLKIDEQSLEGRRAINTLIAVQRERELAVAAEKERQQRQQQDQIAGLHRELALIGATSAERTRALAIAEAEAQIREKKLRGAEAELELSNAIANAEARIALDRGRAARDLETSRIMDQYDLRAGLARDPRIRADIEAEREYVRQIRAGADASQAAAEAERVRARGMSDMAMAQDQYLQGQAERIQQQQIELALIGQTAETRARVLALVAAEREIIATGATGEIADQMRSQALVEAEYAKTIEAQADAWQRVQSAGEAAIDGVLDKLRGGDVKGAMAEMLGEIEKGFFDLAVRNPLKNMLLGTNLGTWEGIGGWSGIMDRFSGRAKVDERALVAQAATPVQSMMVTAASVTLAGNLSGIAPAANLVANANTSPVSYAGGLPGSGDVQAQMWQFFSAKGLAPHQVAAILGHSAAESGFNPAISGDNGNAVGLFQHNGPRMRGLLDAIGGSGNLGDVQAQLEYVWREFMTSESGAFGRLKAAPDLASATWAMQGFERPSGYDANVYGSGMHFDKRLAAAEQAALQFGNSVQAAGSQIDAGGNKAATGLAQAGQGAMAASQGMGAFGQLLSGIGGMVGGKTGSILNTVVGIGGALLGGTPLFKTGGFTGGSDPDRAAGIVHEGEYVFDAVATRRIGVQNLEGIRKGGMRGFRSGGYVGTSPAIQPGNMQSAPANNALPPMHFSVDVSGARGDREIEMMVHQAVTAGVTQGIEIYDREALPTRIRQVSNDRWGG